MKTPEQIFIERQLLDAELEKQQQLHAKKRGRKATGRTSKVVRVPLDCDIDAALKLYYDWLPTLEHYQEIAKANPSSVRNEKLVQLFKELGEL
jgi:hypothetical protein